MGSGVIKIVLSVAIIGGSGVYLLSSSMSEQLEYFHPADAVIARAGELKGQRIRVGGYVEKGSIFHKTGTLEYQFDVRPVDGMIKYQEARGKTVTIRYTGIVPDTFKDDNEVIATGRLGEDGVFHATEILAKCPSKYEAEEKNQGRY